MGKEAVGEGGEGVDHDKEEEKKMVAVVSMHFMYTSAQPTSRRRRRNANQRALALNRLYHPYVRRRWNDRSAGQKNIESFRPRRGFQQKLALIVREEHRDRDTDGSFHATFKKCRTATKRLVSGTEWLDHTRVCKLRDTSAVRVLYIPRDFR